MMAMQYSVRLPTEYPVERLRQRVRERGPLFDRLPGLAHKSFLIDEKLRTYAPFYVWRSHDAMREFLFGNLFAGVIDSFGRPRIRHWSVVQFGHGDRKVRPTFACYEIDKVSQESSLAEMRARETELHQSALAQPGLFAHVTALDADRWEVCRFSLWADAKARPAVTSDCSLGYEVMYVSEPAL